MEKRMILLAGIISMTVSTFSLSGDEVGEKKAEPPKAERKKAVAAPEEKSLKKDKALLFYAPFDFSVEPEVIYHPREGKLTGEAEFVEGVVGKAISLTEAGEGIVDYAGMGNNINPNKGTLMFWVKPNWFYDDNKLHRLITIWLNENGYIYIGKGVTDKNYTINCFNLYSNPGDKGRHGEPIKLFKKGRWLHIAITWDGEKQVCFVTFNGNEIRKGTWAKRPPARQLRIGSPYMKDGKSIGHPDAAFDELYIFKRKLSPEEIKAYYNKTRPKEEE